MYLLVLCRLGARALCASLLSLLLLMSAPRAEEPRPVRILLNWLAQADQAGYWQIEQDHLGADQGLAISLRQGGPKIQTIPQVASGQAEFGIGNADDLLLARLQGAPVRAVFVSLDHVPYTLVYHPDPTIHGLADLRGHVFAVSIGAAYWEWVKQHAALGHVREIPVSGDLTLFRTSPDLVQQGYSLFLPARLAEAGVPAAQIRIADLGYRPYDVLFTTDELIAREPELVRRVVALAREGWTRFFADPAPVNATILRLNSQFTPVVEAAAVAEMRAELLPADPARLGCMQDARWQELRDQLHAAGFLPAGFEAATAYTTRFLPGCAS